MNTDWGRTRNGVRPSRPGVPTRSTPPTAADADRRTQARTNWAVWVALDRYDSDAAVRASAQGQPFVDRAGALEANLSPDESEALRNWALSLAAGEGPTAFDVGFVGAGAVDIIW